MFEKQLKGVFQVGREKLFLIFHSQGQISSWTGQFLSFEKQKLIFYLGWYLAQKTMHWTHWTGP